ncbi:DASH complex subunit Duo1-domain-containing protein [Linnemannia elongata]|nr:DASH complex subunit Duo1-domain-containing protein [Linnemannia elongata]
MSYLKYQTSSNGTSAPTTSNNNFSLSSSEHANANAISSAAGLPLGMRTPSRVKRARYNVDPPEVYASEQQEQQQQQQQRQRQQEAQQQVQQQQQRTVMSTSVGAGGAGSGGTVLASSSYSQGSILTELEETRRLVRAFDAIDTSMNEARDKLKTFYKTADETNTLLDMWIRVLSQTEHTQKLLQDPAWEGQTMEEARDREHQERRAAYHLAMEEATRPQNTLTSNTNINTSHQGNPKSLSSSTSNVNNSSSSSRHFSSSINNPTSILNRSQTQMLSSSTTTNSNYSGYSNPLKKSSSALAAAAHAHASAIAANRKRNLAAAAAGGGSGVGDRS